MINYYQLIERKSTKGVGEVFICENLPYKKEFVLGDLRKQSVMEYWNSDRVKQWLFPPPREYFSKEAPCRICKQELYDVCHTTFSGV